MKRFPRQGPITFPRTHLRLQGHLAKVERGDGEVNHQGAELAEPPEPLSGSLSLGQEVRLEKE